SLDILAHVKSRLGISGSGDDTLLGLLQDSADKFIENWCDRDFAGGTFTEYHPGGSEFVFLRNFPVASITSVKVDPGYTFGSETLLASSAYVVHLEGGAIESLGGPFYPAPRVVQVVYTVATGQVPDDIKEAYARLVCHWYRQVKTESGSNFLNVAQQKFGDTFQIFNNSGGDAIPKEVRGMLMPYRVPRI
ncbi:MAG: phage head-tail connector protein, partial [Planctomycetes bacterium]|nr:phage head-tail connector protein [Planctomycetota bacterium]